MLCPFCREKDTSVVDSRPTEDGAAIRRRRVCGCERKERFTTFERVQFRELTVVKNNGRKEPFERDKIPTATIGKFIMDGLSNLDQVAYVRFASVYKNFKEAKDFEQFIGNLNEYKSE